jgi:DNA repair photolyase
MDHAFEDVAVKRNAIALLEDALKRRRKPCMIGAGSMTDPYIPLEEELGHVRQALELVLRYGFGITLITKSARVLRDLDLLAAINWRTKCVVQMTLTTYDEALCRKLEPHVSTTRERFQALLRLREAGIPTMVWLCPILPFINDTRENLEGVLDLCLQAGVYGVVCFGMGMTLREGSREYFYAQLDRLFPGIKERYIAAYGSRYLLESPNSRQLTVLFHDVCRRGGVVHDNDSVFQYLRTLEERTEQLSLFG